MFSGVDEHLLRSELQGAHAKLNMCNYMWQMSPNRIVKAEMHSPLYFKLFVCRNRPTWNETRVQELLFFFFS